MVNKTDFPILFKEAFEKTMSIKTIISGFRTSGICPFNPEATLTEKLMPSDGGTVTVSQVQQATTSDKSAEQNAVITPGTSKGFSPLPGACKNPLVPMGFSLFYIKITVCVKKSLHQHLGPCCLHLTVFSLYIHSPLLLENKKFL